jgi:DNA polymerase III alpha subunit
MFIDKFSRVELTESEAFDLLYQKDIDIFDKIYVDVSTFDKFYNSKKSNGDEFNFIKKLDNIANDVIQYDQNNQKNWFMPKNYFPNLIEHLYSLCVTQEEITRVNEELELYHKHNMIELLFYLKYLVDVMRENKIVWGVGRGSSVSSYILFLIGVHKINSLKFNLDHKEFFK